MIPDTININDVFWTFQGEGFHAGRRALFVRMPYCNLACSWCDTQFNTFQKWSRDELVGYANTEASRFAVLTGGEPMLNKHSPHVIDILNSIGFKIACETNGTYPILPGIHFATVSPKRDAQFEIHPHAFERANEFKYVVDDGFDFKILDKHNGGDNQARLSLSPEFGQFDENLKKIFGYIKRHPHWVISLQTHKWMKIA